MDGEGLRPTSVTALFVRLGQLFAEGRTAEMAQFWSYPCPIEVNGTLVVMRDAAALASVMAERRRRASEAGLLMLEPHIVAVEIPRGGRFRVWLRWVHHYEGASATEENVSLYFLARQADGTPIIEMMDLVLSLRQHVLAASG
jgi:hypothetical protein